MTASPPPPEDLPMIPSPSLIVQDDFGRYRIDIFDVETPGFESRHFAEAVRLARTRHDPLRCRP
jgi:hypothetical protein